MTFDDQLERYFGTRDLNGVSESALAAGIERMAVDFGLATDRRQKFALLVPAVHTGPSARRRRQL